MPAIWHRASSIAEVVSEAEGRVALLNLSEPQPMVLTGSAAVIWGLIDGQQTERDILAELRALYPAEDGDAIEAQLASFLIALQRQGFAEARA
ncbi:PqqD family protein [Sinomonas sp. G460-2]|uniref:PqqD family protein n=1 Tax=Sinomonas sp. G460-2 TaxID=3393464 RepID=UPI0039F103B3